MSGNRLVFFSLALWAVVATVAAVYFASREPPAAPPPEPSPPPAAPRLEVELPPAGGIQLGELLKLALDKPADDGDDRPMIERIGSLIRDMNALEDSDAWSIDKAMAFYRKIRPLIAYETDSHLAMMELLKQASTQDEADDILEFLVWSPFGKMVRHEKVTEEIKKSARDLLASDPNPARRYGATRVLYRYGRPTKEDVLYGINILKEESDVEVRDCLLDEITVAGPDKGLTRGEAEPFLNALRSRLGEGEHWCANALADWSDTEEDFRWIKRLVNEDRDFNRRYSYINAFASGTPLVRGREKEARAVLQAIVTDRTSDIHMRRLARGFLQSYGPLDADDAAAVRAFEEDWKNR